MDWNTLMTEHAKPQATHLLAAANDNPGGGTRTSVALASLVHLLAHSYARTTRGRADIA